MNFKLLPSFLNNFVKIPDNLEKYLPTIREHTWLDNYTSTFFTEEGINWFANKGIELRPTCMIFTIDGNDVGLIHTDHPLLYSINFVLQGSGKMQWIDVGDQSPTMKTFDVTRRIIDVPVFEDCTSNKIIDTWDDAKHNVALVKVNTPHQIISTTLKKRICLAIRPTTESMKLIESFEDVAELF